MRLVPLLGRPRRFCRGLLKGRRDSRGPTGRRLHVEPLEQRQLLSVGPALLADLYPAEVSSFPNEFVEVGEIVFFLADDGTHGIELWKTDGTTAGTEMVKDLFPGSTSGYNGDTPNSSAPQDLTSVGGTLFFTADDGTNGRELWTSDATAAGTVMVKDLLPGSTYQDLYGDVPNSSAPQDLTDLDGTLFFTADDGANGRELWTSDGTADGTVMVKDLFPGSTSGYYGDTPNSSSPQNLTAVNGTLYFSADDGTNGRELWTSDGTAAGTVMIKDLQPGSGYSYDYDYGYQYGPNSSSPQNLTGVDGTLYFTADDGLNGVELWKSDGTAAGTVTVKDLAPGSTSDDYYGDLPNSSQPQELTDVDGSLFFTADDGTNGRELWQSDGTASGTIMVKDLFPGSGYNYYYDGYYNYGYRYGPNSAAPKQLTNVDGTLFFTAEDEDHGRELWKSDGTASGTLLVKDVNPEVLGDYPTSSYPDYLTNVDGVLHFSANDGTHGQELWMSDGTSIGTFLVADLRPGSVNSYPSALAGAGGTLFFAADDGSSGHEPWTHQPITAEDYGTLSGLAFSDVNGNGLQDPGDVELEGVTIFIDSNENWDLDEGEPSTVTDAAGVYTLRAPPGTYDVLELVPAGLAQSAPLDPDTDPTSHTVTLELGEGVGDLDFANYTMAAPDVVDLLPATDSGSADDDNITSFNNASPESKLQFLVTGVAHNAWVLIYAGAQQIGQGTAVGGTATVTTSGVHPLADGSHEITAVQIVGDATSDPSQPLLISVNTTLPVAVDDLGTVDFLRMQDEEPAAGELHYRFTARRDGLLTAEIAADQLAQDAQITLYKDLGGGQQQQLASGTPRVDFDQAVAGESYYVRVTGLQSPVGVTLANLVTISPSGSSANVHGTAGDDTFEVTAGEKNLVSINGVTYEIQQSATVRIFGEGGSDSATLSATDGNDSATLYPGSGVVSGPGFDVELSGVASILVHGGAGANTLTLFDSAGDDLFVGKPDYSAMEGDGFTNRATSFQSATADSMAGGADAARFYDSAGDDTFEASPDEATLSGDGFAVTARSFDTVNAFATAGGNDEATLQDSAGDDFFFASPVEAAIYGDGFFSRVKHFETVVAYSNAGGSDEGRLYDSTGDDEFTASPAVATLSGGGVHNEAWYFEDVSAFATEGGADDATLSDSQGNDLFVGSPIYGALSGEGFHNRSWLFDTVSGVSTGGFDVAKLFDSVEDDTFEAYPQQAALYVAGQYRNQVDGFEMVHAYATAGGMDTAQLHGSSADEFFYSNDEHGALYQRGVYYNRAKYFEQIYGHADGSQSNGGGNDKAELHDSPQVDLLEGQRDWLRFSSAALGLLYEIDGFDHVKAVASSGGNTNAIDPAAVNYVLELEGPW